VESILQQLGFTEKEIDVYLLLIDNGPKTAAELTKLSGDKRSNTYMVLDSLLMKRVITADDQKPIRTFAAASPRVLKKIVTDEQERQKQLASALDSVMSKLSSRYALAIDKPGITYMQGAEGFMTLLRDMTRSTTEVQLIASNKVPTDTQVLKDFRQLLVKRKKAGIRTRAIFHRDNRSALQKDLFAARGIELRFLGETEFDGEVAIYEDNVAFTVYEPSLMVMVITNPSISTTMRTVFEQLWESAKT
jgi:sugar-specific transcriptional regulator TrmB